MRTCSLLGIALLTMAACTEAPSASDTDEDTSINEDDGVTPVSELDDESDQLDPDADPNNDGAVLEADDPDADAADELAEDPATEVADAGDIDNDDEYDAEEPLDADAPADPVSDAAIPTKIRYVLVIVKENHTFDNYFTGFPGASSSFHAFKFDKAKNKRVRFMRPVAPRDTLASGPSHTHHAALAAYRNGHMDGFSVNPGMTPYIRYTKHQIPSYWKYASNFVLADHFFSTTLGPSSPGHEVFWFGRSTTLDNAKCHLKGGTGCGHGCTGNHLTATTFNPRTGKTRTVAPCFDLPSLPDHLPQGFTWFDYGGQMAKQIKSQAHVNEAAHYGSSKKLLTDLRAGKLHNLMIAHISGGEISEHPRSGPCKGERFSVEVINAAMKLPEWKHMAILVTWDDWGGFYDHVKPPVRKAANGARFGSGFRLPLIVISPYAKQGVVLKTPTEQASVPKLVEQLWGMSFMSTRNKNARDGVAGSLLGAFDFSQAPRPPLLLDTRSCPGDAPTTAVAP